FVLFNFDGGHPGRTFQLPGVVNALLQAALEDGGLQGLRMLPLRPPECKGLSSKSAGRGWGWGISCAPTLFAWLEAVYPMRVLGLEASCDDTGVALYDSEQGLLADALFSQIDLLRVYGGVVPELASRDHVKRMLPLIRQVLDEAGCAAESIDAIAYTAGP